MTIESNAGGARPRIAVVMPRRTAVRRQGQPLAGQRLKPVPDGAIDDPVPCGPAAGEYASRASRPAVAR
jgi:hypothetical protein